MTLSDWASIAEILGAIAIVVSLAFVAFEIRRNTQASRAATYQEHMGFEIGLLATAASDADLSRIYMAVVADEFDSLDKVEQQRATWLMGATYRPWEGYYLQYKRGMMSKEAWKAREAVIQQLAQLSIAREFIDTDVISGDFANYIRGVWGEAKQARRRFHERWENPGEG